ncbi:FAD-binding domain-containing protein [Sediminicoccus rosea]|uniref:FAD-binding domain-containing protein n=1 Tax=Sediminicoccus rosea TaxID=1225128 RepID=A0ABZ0PG64_9PROT|nr:FAD-binding domain-containing protein [Sediminicoccus rosea]WPB84620.1 FAD-binding domain-containing protein [Sediminicoccus rosea]
MLDVVWFKRDLRVTDHAALAAAKGTQGGPVLPLYIVEPDYWRGEDASPRQWRFLRAALEDLRAQLATLGLPLVVRKGDAVALLARLHAERGIRALHSHEETGNLWTYARDRAVARFCQEAGVPWHEYPQFGVVRRLASRDGWARRWAGFMGAPVLAPPRGLMAPAGIIEGALPEQPFDWNPEDGLVEAQPAGRAAALALLEGFLAGRGADYRRGMSSPLSAPLACSRLSPHLAMGSVSMREVVQRVERAGRDIAAQPPGQRPVPLGAVQSLASRLHWHCHFIQKLESEPALERRAAHPAAEAARRPTAPDDPRLLAWAGGRTGYPFLDACMRSLIATGWINFRMRAMLQSFASHHLDLDWAASGAHLARLFVDYEPGIHWPQVQMQSGATGINTPRLYNPVKQGLDQDAEAVFIARWVPEVAHLPPGLRHVPWKLDAPPAGYPAPVVELSAALHAARERISRIRAAAGFDAEARRVFQKHGSRQRRFAQDDPMGERARAARREAKARRQLSLDL